MGVVLCRLRTRAADVEFRCLGLVGQDVKFSKRPVPPAPISGFVSSSVKIHLAKRASLATHVLPMRRM